MTEPDAHAGHVVVSLDDLFGDAHITAVEEMALDGAQRLSDVRRLRWRAGDSITHGDGDRPREAADAGAGLVADYLGPHPLGEVRRRTLRWACSWLQGHKAMLSMIPVCPDKDVACPSGRRVARACRGKHGVCEPGGQAPVTKHWAVRRLGERPALALSCRHYAPKD